MAQCFYDSRHITTPGSGLLGSLWDGKLRVLSDAGSVSRKCSTRRAAAKVTDRGDVRPYTNLEARASHSGCASGDVIHRPCASRLASQLNTLAPHTPEGFGAAHWRACTRAAVSGCRRTSRRGSPRRADTRPQVFAVCADIGFCLSRQPTSDGILPLTQKQKTNTGEAACITGM